MQEMEMQLFEALDSIVDALVDGHKLCSKEFLAAAITHGHKDDRVMIEQVVAILREKFCDAK